MTLTIDQLGRMCDTELLQVIDNPAYSEATSAAADWEYERRNLI